jgi:hypothetical protein
MVLNTSLDTKQIVQQRSNVIVMQIEVLPLGCSVPDHKRGNRELRARSSRPKELNRVTITPLGCDGLPVGTLEPLDELSTDCFFHSERQTAPAI